MSIERILGNLGIEAELRGKEWYARCPNPEHDDRNPSWRIRDEEGKKYGLHNCWSCGFSGDLASLVMAMRKVGYREARAYLETEGMNVEGLSPTPNTVELEVAKGKRRFKIPEGVDFTSLDKWVSSARHYVLSRGIEPWQIERWGIGYAVDGQLGGRIVIPYENQKGVPVGYTARTFVDDAKRYLEPGGKEGADLGVMFGERHWGPTVSRETVYVTEGALNALAVERALTTPESGYPALAATAGSSLRPAHAAKLATFREVVVLTDPDPAGDKIASEVKSQLARHTKVSRVRLRERTDAADTPRDELRRAILAR